MEEEALRWARGGAEGSVPWTPSPGGSVLCLLNGHHIPSRVLVHLGPISYHGTFSEAPGTVKDTFTT